MKVMPIRFLADVEESERFYAVLGLNSERRGRTPGWTEMAARGGSFGRFMQVVDPEGLVLQVQAHDPSLYT